MPPNGRANKQWQPHTKEKQSKKLPRPQQDPLKITIRQRTGQNIKKKRPAASSHKATQRITNSRIIALLKDR